MSKYKTRPEYLCSNWLAGFITLIIAVIACSLSVSAQDAKQEKFKSPEDAFEALIDAAKTNDTMKLLAICGSSR